MRSRRARSQFTALSDAQRTNVREAAVTMAQQGLRRGGAENVPNMGADHSSQQHQPGDVGGTYNSSHAANSEGSTDPNTGGGVELMARVIVNQTGNPSGPAKPAPGTQKAPPWPAAPKTGQDSGPIMPRRKKS